MTDDFHTLPVDCVAAFCSVYKPADQAQPIRIVFGSVPGFVPNALVALTLDDAKRLCNQLNARLGLDYDAW